MISAILLPLLACCAIVIVCNVTRLLVRGRRRRDIFAGASLFLLIAYITIGTGLATYLAATRPLAEAPDVEYDSRYNR